MLVIIAKSDSDSFFCLSKPFWQANIDQIRTFTVMQLLLMLLEAPKKQEWNIKNPEL